MPIAAARVASRPAMLMVWTAIAAAEEAGFNDWYNREHLRERIGLPGFIRGRRYQAESGGTGYLALYEISEASALQSEPYLRLKQSRDLRSLHFVPLFRNTIKATCDVVLQAGVGEGAWLALLPVRHGHKAVDALRVLFDSLVQQSGIMAASLGVSNQGARAASAGHDLRPGDRHAESVVLVEAATRQGAELAGDALARFDWQAHGASPDLVEQPCLFRSLYTLHAHCLQPDMKDVKP